MTRKQEDYPEENPMIWLALIVIVIILMCLMGIWLAIT